MAISQVRAVHEQWSAPDAPEVGEWALMAAVQAFLASAAGRHIDEPGTSVVTISVAAQIKGSDGDGQGPARMGRRDEPEQQLGAGVVERGEAHAGSPRGSRAVTGGPHRPLHPSGERGP